MKYILSMFLLLTISSIATNNLSAQTPSGNEIYRQVDKKPVFTGGSLSQYVIDNLNLKDSEILKDETYLVQFVVTKEGTLEGIKFLKGENKNIQAKIHTMLVNMPKWIPAESKGNKVDCYFSLPINLKRK